jgi:hypothetical protein
MAPHTMLGLGVGRYTGAHRVCDTAALGSQVAKQPGATGRPHEPTARPAGVPVNPVAPPLQTMPPPVLPPSLARHRRCSCRPFQSRWWCCHHYPRRRPSPFDHPYRYDRRFRARTRWSTPSEHPRPCKRRRCCRSCGRSPRRARIPGACDIWPRGHADPAGIRNVAASPDAISQNRYRWRSQAPQGSRRSVPLRRSSCRWRQARPRYRAPHRPCATAAATTGSRQAARAGRAAGTALGVHGRVSVATRKLPREHGRRGHSTKTPARIDGFMAILLEHIVTNASRIL